MVIKMVWISKAVFSLCPYFRIVLIRAEHTLASSEPVVACQEVDVVVQGIVSRETAEPALVVEVEIGAVSYTHLQESINLDCELEIN